MKRILNRENVQEFVQYAVTTYQEELQNKLNLMAQYKDIIKELEDNRIVTTVTERELKGKYNASVRYSIEQKFRIYLQTNLLEIEDGVVKAIKVAEATNLVFERVQSKYNQFIEGKNSISIMDKSVLYTEGGFWEYKVREAIELITTYYNINIDINDIIVPTETGKYDLVNGYTIKLFKNGKITISK